MQFVYVFYMAYVRGKMGTLLTCTHTQGACIREVLWKLARERLLYIYIYIYILHQLVQSYSKQRCSRSRQHGFMFKYIVACRAVAG
jgi:hypothetical protein